MKTRTGQQGSPASWRNSVLWPRRSLGSVGRLRRRTGQTSSSEAAKTQNAPLVSHSSAAYAAERGVGKPAAPDRITETAESRVPTMFETAVRTYLFVLRLYRRSSTVA